MHAFWWRDQIQFLSYSARNGRLPPPVRVNPRWNCTERCICIETTVSGEQCVLVWHLMVLAISPERMQSAAQVWLRNLKERHLWMIVKLIMCEDVLWMELAEDKSSFFISLSLMFYLPSFLFSYHFLSFVHSFPLSLFPFFRFTFFLICLLSFVFHFVFVFLSFSFFFTHFLFILSMVPSFCLFSLFLSFNSHVVFWRVPQLAALYHASRPVVCLLLLLRYATRRKIQCHSGVVTVTRKSLTGTGIKFAIELLGTTLDTLSPRIFKFVDIGKT